MKQKISRSKHFKTQSISRLKEKMQRKDQYPQNFALAKDKYPSQLFRIIPTIILTILLCSCDIESTSDSNHNEKKIDLKRIQKLSAEGFQFYEEINPFTLNGIDEIDPSQYLLYIKDRSLVGILDHDSTVIYKWFKNKTESTITYVKNPKYGYYKAEYSFWEDELIDSVREFVIDSVVVEARINEGLLDYKHLHDVTFKYPDKKSICYTIKNPTEKIYSDHEILFDLNYTDTNFFESFEYGDNLKE